MKNLILIKKIKNITIKNLVMLKNYIKKEKKRFNTLF